MPMGYTYFFSWYENIWYLEYLAKNKEKVPGNNYTILDKIHTFIVCELIVNYMTYNIIFYAYLIFLY